MEGGVTAKSLWSHEDVGSNDSANKEMRSISLLELLGSAVRTEETVEGMEAERVIALLEGNTCGPRSTSCADQLTRALREALSAESAS